MRRWGGEGGRWEGERERRGEREEGKHQRASGSADDTRTADDTRATTTVAGIYEALVVTINKAAEQGGGRDET